MRGFGVDSNDVDSERSGCDSYGELSWRDYYYVDMTEMGVP